MRLVLNHLKYSDTIWYDSWTCLDLSQNEYMMKYSENWANQRRNSWRQSYSLDCFDERAFKNHNKYYAIFKIYNSNFSTLAKSWMWYQGHESLHERQKKLCNFIDSDFNQNSEKWGNHGANDHNENCQQFFKSHTFNCGCTLFRRFEILFLYFSQFSNFSHSHNCHIDTQFVWWFLFDGHWEFDIFDGLDNISTPDFSTINFSTMNF